MRSLPNITKNLLLINIVVYFMDFALRRHGIHLTDWLGLHYCLAGKFHVWQLVTYMFMHANFSHIFCNMFAVLMFAPVLEREWGEKKFLLYYLVCGMGAALTQQAVWAIQVQPALGGVEPETIALLTNNMVTIGASGAVFGILLAFGWLFPSVEMFLLFLPIPIRARTFVILYAVFELFAGLAPISGDNVAHFAHLGGMLFGLILLLWWRRDYIRWPKWLQWKKKFTRLDSTDSTFSGYHYQRRVDDDATK